MNELLAGELLRQKLRPHYLELLNAIAATPPKEKNLTVFSPLVGSHFNRSQSGLLICGRAVDSWRNLLQPDSSIENSLEKIFKIPNEDIESRCEMNWIQRNRKAWPTDKNNKYNYKSSSFWSCSRDVVKALEGSSDINESNWQSRVAWSNIYKVSPHSGGNPGDSLRSTQFQHCIDILRTEITILEPKNILFVIGDWGKKILAAIDVHVDYEKRNIVQYTGRVGKANVVVAVRPERLKRKYWVNEVVSAFKRLH